MSGTNTKRSRAALRDILADESDDLGEDPRSHRLLSMNADDPKALKVIGEVFAGTGLPENPEKVRRIMRVRSEIQAEWGRARDSFLSIGRALLSLEFELTKAEFARLRQGSQRLLPFSDATATQLRQIARAVDAGRIAAESCPGSYGTAYQLTLLSDHQMRAAKDRGLIRPDVTRREIQQLRREVSESDLNLVVGSSIDARRLTEEQSRLVERRKALLDELNAVETRLSKIDELLTN
jgi:hypothetical protein